MTPEGAPANAAETAPILIRVNFGVGNAATEALDGAEFTVAKVGVIAVATAALLMDPASTSACVTT